MATRKRTKSTHDFGQFTLFDETTNTDIEHYDALKTRLYSEPPKVTNQLTPEQRLRLARAH